MSRVSTEILPDGSVGVRIRAERSIFPMLFLPVWLTGWTFGGVFAFRALLQSFEKGHPQLFLVVWLCGWVFGECFAVLTLLWMAFGAELVTVRDGELRWRRDLLGYGPTKRWPVDSVRNLRASGFFPGMMWAGRKQQQMPWGANSGNVAFDCEGSTYRIGVGLSEQESNELVEALRPYIPTQEVLH